jgi:hypothetical protein
MGNFIARRRILMSRKSRVAALLVILVFGCGCMDVTTTITVNKDGSGTITETMYMGAMMQQMMTQMMGGMGGGGNAPPPEQPIDVAKYKAKAGKMGNGVTFVSAKKVKKEDGASGEQAIYSFSDVTKVKLQSEPEKPGGGKPQGGMGGKKPKSITFDFTKGDTAKLTLNMPQDAASEEAAKIAHVITPKTEAPSAAEMGQMKQMFNGFRFRMEIKVEGDITKTNASYADKNTVTILDMNIGELLQDQGQFEKLAAMGPIKDMETAKKMLKDFPGLKIETEEKVDIEFK